MLTRDDAPPPMNLSTAIRLGAMLKPRQVFHGYTDGGEGACALQAATVAVPLNGRAIVSVFPIAEATSAICPACGETRDATDRSIPVTAIMVHLNDRHRWTREQIADWVEGLEAAQAHAAPPSTNAVREDVGEPFVPLRV